SVRLHANSSFHGRRCSNLSRPRSILRGTHPMQEQEEVCLTPTRATYYTVGNTDAETACSSTMRSKLVASKALLRCGDKFLAELRKKHQQAGSASVLTFDAATQSIELPASLPAKPRIVCRMSAT